MTTVVAVVDWTVVFAGIAAAVVRSVTDIPGTTVEGTAANVSVVPAAAVAALAVRLTLEVETEVGSVTATADFFGPLASESTAPTIAMSPNDLVAGTNKLVIGVTVMYLSPISPPLAFSDRSVKFLLQPGA